VVQAEGERIRDYAYKPDEPASTLIANEVFVFTLGRLWDVLEPLAQEAGDEGLDDLGDELLSRLPAGVRYPDEH
jgi:glucose-1-phosphate adenylyltransferase